MLSGGRSAALPAKSLPLALGAVLPRLGRPSARWFPDAVPGAACGAYSPPSLHGGAVFAFVSLPEERVHGGARGARAGAAGRGAGLALGGGRARRAPRGGPWTQVSERRRRNPYCGAAAAASGHYSRGAGRPPASGSPCRSGRRWCLPSRRRGHRAGGASRPLGRAPSAWSERVERPTWPWGWDTGTCPDTAHAPRPLLSSDWQVGGRAQAAFPGTPSLTLTTSSPGPGAPPG